MYMLFFVFRDSLRVFSEKTDCAVLTFSKISAVQFLSKNQKLFVFLWLYFV